MQKSQNLSNETQNSINKTQNSSKKLKVSANSFGWVAENRSKLEDWVNVKVSYLLPVWDGLIVF